MIDRTKRWSRRTALAAAMALVPGVAAATSFQLLDQSVSGQGTAYAGTASQASDATTVFFNPAGMAQLDGRQVSAGFNLIRLRRRFDDQGSTAGTGTALERPLSGSDGDSDITGALPIPYYVQPLNERWTFGLGVSSPFGLTKDYADGWQGRYQATSQTIETLNINPTFSYAVTDTLSFGAGVSYQQASSNLQNEVDSFAVCANAGGTAAYCAGQHGGPGNRAADSSLEIEGADADFVFDLSMHWRPVESTSIGITWRQGPDYTFEGDADFDQSSSCASDPLCSGTLATLEGDIEAEARFPDTLTVSISHSVNDRWRLHGDLAWTEWSVLDDIEIVNSENGRTVATEELQYDDTVRAAVGTTYRPGGPWSWRTGVGFEQAAQTDPELASLGGGEEARTRVSFGFNYAVSAQGSVDVAYSHVFVSTTEIDSTTQGNTLVGETDASFDIIGVQGNWRF